MMEANEESEIAESMGRVARTAMSGGMQTAETGSRRAQMRQAANERETQDAQRQQEALQRLQDRDHREEAGLASVIRKDSYSRDFWAHAGSEQIADYATVSAHLAPRHAEARSAYMHISDVLRNDYGITIEQINRDHPSALMDRHHALRDALDDHFGRRRLDAEADAAHGQGQQSSQQPATDEDLSAGTDSAGPESAGIESAGSDTQTVVQDSEQSIDRRAGEENEFPAAADLAGKDETQSLADADRFGAEANRDAAHTQAKESTGGRQPRPYQRASDAELEQLRGRDSQAAEVRGRTRQNFPQPAQDRVFHAQAPATRRSPARSASSQAAQSTRDLEVGR